MSLRNTLGKDVVSGWSDVLFSRVFKLEPYRRAKVVLAYMDFRNEVMTGGFIRKCMNDGKRVALPKVETNSDKKDLSVYVVNDLERDTVSGFTGIIEPDSRILEQLDPREIDLAVIPGVAFDRLGNRIGYGAGYYDRFLSKLRGDCVKIGAAFSLQLVDALPAEEQDIPIDMIATEEVLIMSIQNRTVLKGCNDE